MKKKTKENQTITWEQSVVAALQRLGGEAKLKDLYQETAQVRKEKKLPLSATHQATIRRTVQLSRNFAQKEKKSGVWQLVKGCGVN